MLVESLSVFPREAWLDEKDLAALADRSVKLACLAEAGFSQSLLDSDRPQTTISLHLLPHDNYREAR